MAGTTNDGSRGAGHEPTSFRPLLQHYLKDLVYGANDGIITTFAVVAGASGASLGSSVVLILGFANLLADGFSMGASNFLAIRSDEAVRRTSGRPVEEPFPARHGTATFVAFLLAGVIPLVSYVLIPAGDPFVTAILLTLSTLFCVGALRSLVTDTRWWRAGAEMLLVGALAAAVAYGVGAGVKKIVDQDPPVPALVDGAEPGRPAP